MFCSIHADSAMRGGGISAASAWCRISARSIVRMVDP
jgi:hypothetical protein